MDKNKEHYIALDKFNGHYSWYNINSTNNNNKISYSHDAGKTNTVITFPDGIYNYIKSSLMANGHTVDGKNSWYQINF